MENFCIEYYIDNGNGEKTKLSALKANDFEKWKQALEAYALSEYYNRKIKISKTN